MSNAMDSFTKLLGIISNRELDIIRLRYGIGKACKSHTLKDIGKIIGVTTERVRQIEAKAIRKIRYCFDDNQNNIKCIDKLNNAVTNKTNI